MFSLTTWCFFTTWDFFLKKRCGNKVVVFFFLQVHGIGNFEVGYVAREFAGLND